MADDPFGDAAFATPDVPIDLGDDPSIRVTSAPAFEVHIRSQQRNGRKSLTSVQGLPPELNLKRVLRHFKKTFCCSGSILDDTTLGRILQLQGDQRTNIAEFLEKEGICKKEQIKVHGVVA
jgi:translation initiation factor 1